MLFNTIEFWVFFGVLVAVLAVVPRSGRNVTLLVASYLFYAAWDWRFCSLLAGSTLLDYFAARWAHPESGRSGTARRWALASSLVVNLGALAIFKYYDFFAQSLCDLFGLGSASDNFLLYVTLPVGISFYTFQTLSYTVDAYHGKLKPARTFRDFALYVSFFPQLVAGPIERASQLLPQIERGRQPTFDDLSAGAQLVAWGLFKKVFVADTLAHPVNAVFASADPTAPEVYLATVAFAFQIYGDFSGYTDIARGVARWLGFELMLNFDLPYFAKNPSDFWRRWHISLSTWLRDYLYIPLGGNQGGRLNTYRNLMITMVLGGLWHGARWNFLLWGIFHGIGLAVHRALTRGRSGALPGSPAANGLKIAAMFQFTLAGWLLFRVENMDQLSRMLTGLVFRWEPGASVSILTYMTPVIVPLVLVQFVQLRTGHLDFMRRMNWPVRAMVVSLCLGTVIILNRSGGAPFIYFQF